jgi:mRNA-degrading endonuclease HigB of HigAB toxin-antitoxin module
MDNLFTVERPLVHNDTIIFAQRALSLMKNKRPQREIGVLTCVSVISKDKWETPDLQSK